MRVQNILGEQASSLSAFCGSDKIRKKFQELCNTGDILDDAPKRKREKLNEDKLQEAKGLVLKDGYSIDNAASKVRISVHTLRHQAWRRGWLFPCFANQKRQTVIDKTYKILKDVNEGKGVDEACKDHCLSEHTFTSTRNRLTELGEISPKYGRKYTKRELKT